MRDYVLCMDQTLSPNSFLLWVCSGIHICWMPERLLSLSQAALTLLLPEQKCHQNVLLNNALLPCDYFLMFCSQFPLKYYIPDSQKTHRKYHIAEEWWFLPGHRNRVWTLSFFPFHLFTLPPQPCSKHWQQRKYTVGCSGPGQDNGKASTDFREATVLPVACFETQKQWGVVMKKDVLQNSFQLWNPISLLHSPPF